MEKRRKENSTERNAYFLWENWSQFNRFHRFFCQVGSGVFFRPIHWPILLNTHEPSPCAGAIKQQVMKITGELWVEMRDGADLHSFFHFDININIGV